MNGLKKFFLLIMSDNIQLGATEVVSGIYYSPTQAVKGKDYKCIECAQKVILRKGQIRKAHFAHYSQTNTCNYYDHPNESQIHKDAKLLMAKLLTERKRIQFIWGCSYEPCYATASNTYAFQGYPSIQYKDGDEVLLEHRDKENKWIADIAIVNKGLVRYIIEIKNTHGTTTARPEPWYEVGALELIENINKINTETDPELIEYNNSEEFIYTIECVRNTPRYCYGSFCWKENWVHKIPEYDENLIGKNCIFCKKEDYEPVYDGATGKFKTGYIRVCVDCLAEDTYKRRVPKAYKPPCYGSCFIQNGASDRYSQKPCLDNCKLVPCNACKVLHPMWVVCKGNGICIGCDIIAYSNTFIEVPFAQKDEVKELGAKWEPRIKKWYIDNDNKNKPCILSRFKEFKVKTTKK